MARTKQKKKPTNERVLVDALKMLGVVINFDHVVLFMALWKAIEAKGGAITMDEIYEVYNECLDNKG